MIEFLGLLAFIACCLTGMASWGIALFHIIAAARNRNAEVPFFRAFVLVNVLFQPELFNARGLCHRQKVVKALVGFLLCCVLGSVVGLTTGAAHLSH